jgi:hypothetical protein
MATTTNGIDLFDQELKLLGSVCRTWFRIEDESMRLYAETFSNMASPLRWQRHAGIVLSSTVAAFNSAVAITEETTKAMAQSSKTGLELFQQAISLRTADAAGTPEKLTGLWDTLLDTAQANTNALLEANRHMLESWTSVAGEKMSRQQVTQAAEQAA